MAFMIKSWAWS